MGTELNERQVLDQIKSNGGTQEMSRKIESWSPDQQVTAARKALYQVVSPHLLDSDCPPDVIAETEALFEGVFKQIEAVSQRSSSRGGTH